MVILTDDQKDPKFIPTKQNILSAMQWLVNGARENDSYVVLGIYVLTIILTLIHHV
jgi:hypothetical protein